MTGLIYLFYLLCIFCIDMQLHFALFFTYKISKSKQIPDFVMFFWQFGHWPEFWLIQIPNSLFIFLFLQVIQSSRISKKRQCFCFSFQGATVNVNITNINKNRTSSVKTSGKKETIWERNFCCETVNSFNRKTLKKMKYQGVFQQNKLLLWKYLLSFTHEQI